MIQLHVGNSFELIKDVASDSVDLVMTDVPYPDSEIHDGSPTIISCDDWVDWFQPMLIEIVRVLKDGGSFVTTFNSKDDRACFHKWVAAADDVSWTCPFHYVMTYFWQKRNLIPGPREQMRVPRDSVDFIAHFAKGEPKVRVTAIEDWSVYNPATHIPTNIIHATVKADESYWLARKQTGVNHRGKYPAMIPDFFIRLMTDPGDVVLEPFNGTGTTTLKAEQLGRRSVGFEVSESNVKLSRRIYEIENVRYKLTRHGRINSNQVPRAFALAG
jgi:site-specific DNA-methyltransferase (adenine-specific)